MACRLYSHQAFYSMPDTLREGVMKQAAGD
jgi:hypothetical protein